MNNYPLIQSRLILLTVLLLSFLFRSTPGLPAQSNPPAKQDSPAKSESAKPASATGLISEDQLIGLPLNGRSYTQLATLEAGVSDPSAGSASRGGDGGNLTVSGSRPTANTFLLDGTNIMNTENQVPRSAAGVQLGSDAAYQVQVFSSSYGAEYGRSSGGVLNSITRAGTDDLHGSFFEYFRNSKLDARNFFDQDREPPPFKRNQFGFTLSGPLLKGRTYWMTSYEAMRDRLTETDVSFFPDLEARLGVITDRDGRPIRRVAIHPSLKPFLELFPLPNSARRGEGVGESTAPRFMPTDENFLTTRLDHKISDPDSLFARYTFDDASSVGGGSTYLFQVLNESRQQYLTLVETHIFSPRALNSVRLGYTRPVATATSVSHIEIPSSLFFHPAATSFGLFDIPGLSPFGPEDWAPAAYVMNSFQFADDVILQRGPHALKMGVEVHRYRWDTFTSKYKWGVWSFNSLDSFLEAGPTGTNLTVALPGSDNATAYRQTLLGFYLQDSYRAASRLQLNLGLRYEFATRIHDRDGRTASLRDWVRDRAPQVGPLFGNNPSLLNLAPRVGVSWSPWGGRDSLLSGSFGIYHDQIIQYLVDRIKNTVPFYNVVFATNFNSQGVFPDAARAAEGLAVSTRTADYAHTSTPVVLRYDLTFQQRLPGQVDFRASFVGARGNHLFRGYEANLFPPPIAGRDGSLCFPPNAATVRVQDLNPNCPPVPAAAAGPVNPAFESIEANTSDAQSFYNSLQASANRRFGRGSSIQASYAFSKSVDDATKVVPTDVQFGPLRTLDRGLSDFDSRHRLSINFFYTLPFGSGQQGWASGLAKALGGWRLGGIARFRSGTPLTPKVNVRTPGYLFAANRPNWLPGYEGEPSRGVTAGCPGVEAGRQLGTADLYLDPCAFSVPAPGTLGNVGRNAILSSSVFSFDVSLQREFLLDAKRRLQFRMEMFNLPNHTTFSSLSGGGSILYAGESGRLSGRAGRINRTATTARQIQFALRFSF